MMTTVVRRYVIVCAGFALFFIAFFSPVLLPGNFLTTPGDGSNLALPAYLIPHGYWEPDILLGYSWASSFNGYWDPLFLLRLIPNSFNAYMLAAYVFAAVGAFACVDALTGSLLGGVIAGLTYALGGFMIGQLGHYDIVHPASWTPFVFCSLIVLRRRSSPAAIVLGAGALGLCAVAGQPQVLVYTLLFAAAYVLAHAYATSDVRRFITGASVMLGGGLGLGAIALLPGAYLGIHSFRAHAAIDYFLAYSVPLWQLPIRLLAPYLVSVSSQAIYPQSTADRGFGPDPEYSSYVGLVTLMLAILAVVTRKKGDWNVPFFACSAIAGLVLSTGDAFHIAVLTYHIPVFNLFRAQSRNLIEFTLFAAILAGIGASRIAARQVRLLQLCIPIVVIGLGLVAIVIAKQFAPMQISGAASGVTDPAVVIPLLVYGMGIVTLAITAGTRSTYLRSGMLVLCCVSDLASFALAQYWRTPVTASMVEAPPFLRAMRTELAASNQRVFSVAGANSGTGIEPNLSLLWQIPSAGGYVSLLPTAPGIFLQLFPQGTMSPNLLGNGTDRSIDLAAIRYIIAPVDKSTALLEARAAWRLNARTPIGSILENEAAEPRVRVVHDVIPMTVDAMLDLIRHGSSELRSTAFVQSGAAMHTQADASDRAQITSLTPDGMKVATMCKAACFLIASDNYNSMWNATIDGGSVPIELTDYTLRGVRVLSGRHVVTFAYRPWIVYLGAAVSLLSAIFVGLYSFRLHRRVAL